MDRWFDARRSVLAAVAAVLALTAAVSVRSDDAMLLFDVAAAAFTALGVIAAGFALWPARGRWSQARIDRAGRFAVIAAFVGPPLWLMTWARAACACADLDGYAPFAPLGVAPHDWLTVATIAVPALMVVTATGAADRLRLPNLRPRDAS